MGRHLVIQSHPVEESYNRALLDRIVEADPSATVVRVGQGDTLREDHFDKTTALTVIYPTWWGSLPSQLLHEFGNVVAPWVDGNTTGSTCPLGSVTNLTVVTSHGSSRLVNRIQGEPGRFLWKRTILPLCAPRATFDWQAMYGMDRATEAERSAFIDALAL